MKKKYLVFLLILLIFLFNGCQGNKVEPNYEAIKFTFPEEYQGYFPYEIPEYSFTFDGVLNTIPNASTTNRKVFGKNDDFVLSNLLEVFFDFYRAENRLTTRILVSQPMATTKMNTLEEVKGELKHVSHTLYVENNMVFNEIAYILLENGLYLSFEYRRFESIYKNELKTFYSWRYTAPLNAVLHYPFIVRMNEANNREFLLITLPANVIYSVGLSDRLPLSRIVKEDIYLNEFYRTFFYPEYNDDPRSSNENFDLEKNIKIVKDYYILYHQGRIENDEFFFTYFNQIFKVTFKNTSFIIDYISPAS